MDLLKQASRLIGKEVYTSIDSEPRHLRWDEWKKRGQPPTLITELPQEVLSIKEDPNGGGLLFELRRPAWLCREAHLTPATRTVLMDIETVAKWLKNKSNKRWMK